MKPNQDQPKLQHNFLILTFNASTDKPGLAYKYHDNIYQHIDTKSRAKTMTQLLTIYKVHFGNVMNTLRLSGLVQNKNNPNKLNTIYEAAAHLIGTQQPHQRFKPSTTVTHWLQYLSTNCPVVIPTAPLKPATSIAKKVRGSKCTGISPEGSC